MNADQGFALGQRLRALGLFGWLRAAVRYGTYPASHQTPQPANIASPFAPAPDTLRMPGYIPEGVPQRYRTLTDLLNFQSSMAATPEFQSSIVSIGGHEYAPAGWVQTGPQFAQYGNAQTGYRAYPALTLTPAGINVYQYGPLYDPVQDYRGMESLIGAGAPYPNA